MKLSVVIAALVHIVVLCGCMSAPQSPPLAATEQSRKLFETMFALDREVFGAFNNCAAPGELERHASFFSESVEFYHDEGGVTWNRREMLENTRKYVCGKFSRELVAGSFRVHAIKGFGALTQGEHKFCQFATRSCDGAAEFVIVWRQDGDKWSITRVLSFGHRPA